MVPKQKYHVQWDVYGALAAGKRPVKNKADDSVGCFLDYSSYDHLIIRNGKIFI